MYYNYFYVINTIFTKNKSIYLTPIIKIFTRIEDAQIKIDKKFYQQELDKVNIAEEKLYDLIGENKELKKVFTEFDDAMMAHDYALNAAYYREGFISGVKVALEICGVDIEK